MDISTLRNYLKELGFSNSEATVYFALLEHGSGSTGPLIASTGLHRNVVYTSLEHLKARKLVSERLIRGVKHFSLTSPEVLSQEFQKKSQIASMMTEEILKRLPNQSQEITIHQGNDEYLTLLTSLLKSLPKKSDKYVLGTGGEEFMQLTMRPIWKPYHEVASDREVRIHMLAYDSQRSAIERDVEGNPLYDVQYLPDEIENPAGIHIYPAINTVLNIIYSNETTPVTAIKIRNKALAEGYLHLFENLWRSAEK